MQIRSRKLGCIESSFEFICVLLCSVSFPVLIAQTLSVDPIAEFTTFATQLAAEPPSDFNPEPEPSANVHAMENFLIRSAESALLQALNKESGAPSTIVIGLLEKLKGISDKAQAPWPDEARFHCQLLDLKPFLVVKFGIRSRDTFVAFSVPEHVGRVKNTQWMRVGYDDVGSQSHSCVETVVLFPLQRGPSAKPRFLAKYEHIDCGSGHRIEYAAYDWDSTETLNSNSTNLHIVLHRKGVMPRGDVDPAIWDLKTSGRIITLPYCWHSAVDTYTAANLCSVDSYDLSEP